MGFTLESFIFLLIAGSAFGYASYRFSILYRLLKAQQGKTSLRWNRFPERITAFFVDVLGQRSLLQDKSAGIMHAIIFWGFLIITIGTTEQFVSTLYHPANFSFIGKVPYGILVFLQDVFTVLVFFAALYAVYRRVVLRIERLGQSLDALMILAFTASLMVSILFMNSFHILAMNPWFSGAMPFSKIFAQLLMGADFSTDSSYLLYKTFKWVHILLVLGFLIYIPHSKHLHVVTASMNVFLKSLDRQKPMSVIPFQDETVQQYGTAKVNQMSWKDALDFYTCTECGRCQDVCPAWNTQKPLSPKNLIIDLRENLQKNRESILAKREAEVTPVIDENVTTDVIWACTSCRACEVACPVYIEHTDKIYDIRRNLVMMESNFPPEVQTVFKNMETNATPWAFGSADRAKWAEGQQVPTVADSSGFDLLLWVGCAGSYDGRNQKVVKSFVNILKRIGVKFAILGKEEGCTGDPARRMGNEYLFQSMAQKNVETLNRYQVKKIVTTCPHCFNTLKNEYSPFGGNYDVTHHTEYLSQLIKDGKIKPTKSIPETVTFHDSCYLGRWNGIYDAPRTALQSIPSVRVVEMKNHHEKSMCCGAGGGRMWMEETIGKRINIARTEQALDTKATVVCSSCPFCMTMMTDGVKAKEMSDKIVVKDLAELLDEATP